jgi:hypothetical protein
MAPIKDQSSTFKKPQNSCPPEKLVEHFKNHFNPPHPSSVETPSELTTDIPDFVKELQQLSRDHPFSNDAPTREEVFNALAKLKNNKSTKRHTSRNPEICKKLGRVHGCVYVIDQGDLDNKDSFKKLGLGKD